ncbi:fibronectin-binding protein, partial [Bifidobacterium animalis subsp. lactis BB-12]
MFRDKKTQFAIRKLTTGTGILLLSVGMGINLSSKEVSASEIDPAQTTETVQTEAATELTAEQEPAVEFSAPVQE